MSVTDQTKDNFVEIEELAELPDKAQAELIADQFANISNQYEPLHADDIKIPDRDQSKPLPLFEPHQIHLKIKKMKKKASTVSGDLPWKIISEFSAELAEPLSNTFHV